MKTAAPWPAAGSGVNHDNTGYTEGNNIERQDRRAGEGRKERDSVRTVNRSNGERRRAGRIGMNCLWKVPEPSAQVDVRTADGTTIVVRRHGNREGPRLVLSHGSGLAIDVYYPFWTLLVERFDLVLYDFRNHGWSGRSAVTSHNIPTFVADNSHVLREIDRRFGPKPKVGVFHSLSATTALQDPPGEGFAALVLFDPALYPPSGDLLDVEKRWKQLAVGTRMRRERFDTREQMVESIRRSPLYRRVLPGVPDLIARATLRPATEGKGYDLRCPRAYETLILEYAFAYNHDPEPSAFSCPVKVIAGDPTGPFSFLPRRDLGGLTALDYDFVPDTTHFLQLENPRACAALMQEFLEQKRLA